VNFIISGRLNECGAGTYSIHDLNYSAAQSDFVEVEPLCSECRRRAIESIFGVSSVRYRKRCARLRPRVFRRRPCSSGAQ
jgi:hypothetical protein